MLPTLGAVARVSTLLWLRDLAALFHLSSKAVIVGVLGAFLSAVALGLVLAAAATQSSIGVYPPELKELLLRTAFSSSSVIGLLTILALAVSLPPRTSFQSLVDLLPVRQLASQVGQLVPVLGLAATFGLALSGVVVAVARQVLEPLAFVAALFAIAGNMLALQMVALGAFLALSSLLSRRLRIPHQYAVTTAAALVMAVGLGVFSRDVFTLSSDLPLGTAQPWGVADLLVTRLAVAAILHGGPFQLLGVGLWWAAGLVALLTAGRLRHSSGSTGGIRLLTGTRPPQGAFLSSIWFEALIAVRTPQFIVTSLMAVLLVVGVRWLGTLSGMGPTAEQLASGLPAVPFALSMYAVGRTLKYRWLGAVVHGSWSWWIAPKAVAYFVVGASVAILLWIFELALGMVSASDVLSVSIRAALVLGAALLGGTLAPYSDEQGLSVAASGFLTGLLVVGSSMFVAWAGSAASATMGVLAELSLAGLFFALYALIASVQIPNAARYV
ncbi:hypothetical protein [Sinomonas humi]|uniref:Uncharacterized protein n=1 Tax=Sinomonas humi TaxID=1338436 RepID=A0A0B2AC16_9MICC|nr:hypothetical protein [Sinomonas humi]KHL01150.1 hypothetical protein LK10_17045 [Sinomonas humi]